MDRRSAVKVDSLDDQISWGGTPEWGLTQSVGTMRSRREIARGRASSIGQCIEAIVGVVLLLDLWALLFAGTVLGGWWSGRCG